MKKKNFFWVAALAFLLVAAVIVYPGGESSAASSPLDDYREQQKQLTADMAELESDIKAQNAVVGGYKSEIAALDAKLITVQKEINALNSSINETNNQIDAANVAIADAEVRLAERQAALESRLVQIYIYGDISVLDVFFEAATFNDFVVLYDMVERVMDQDKDLLDGIQQEMDIIEANKELLLERKSDLGELKNEQLAKAAELTALQDQKYSAMSEANMTLEDLNASLDELDEASEKVASQIKSLLASSGSTVSFGGSFIWPLPSAYGLDSVTSEYGNRFHPITGQYRMHAGIDIGAPNGTAIYAAGEGKILYVGWISGYGQTVMIDHGSKVTTLYAHMSSYGSYSSGEYVVAGDTIGYVGSTGNSTGNHLHFEVRVNGSHTSPWNYLK